jgi:hypothetical protein
MMLLYNLVVATEGELMISRANHDSLPPELFN